jgi:hypothetical protein
MVSFVKRAGQERGASEAMLTTHIQVRNAGLGLLQES